MRSVLLVFVLAGPGFAQGVHFGLKGGVPTTAYFQTGRTGSRVSSSEYSAATRRYTFGASVEWRLTHAFGFEVDTLYKRIGYVGHVTSFGGGILRTGAFDAKGSSWEIPLLAKYRFVRGVRPYLAGGAVLRYIGPVRARGEIKI